MTNPLYSVEQDRYMSGGHGDWPARFATAITPSDTLAVAVGPAGTYAKALYIGVSGDVTVIAAGDNTNSGAGTPVKFTGYPVGWLPVQVRAVMNTGTTASSIVGVAD